MNVVLYHANCTDGFGAAYAAWKALGDRAKYIPCQHTDPPPQLDSSDEVGIFDFSYPRATLLDLKSQVKSLILRDHHASAQTDLGDLDFCHFDLTKSGAVLAWEYFHPGVPVPTPLLRIDDGDRWQFKIPKTKEQYGGMDLYEMDFETWDHIFTSLMPVVLAEGEIVIRHNSVIVERACMQAAPVQLKATDGNIYSGIATNSAECKSEVGAQLLSDHPNSQFSAIYSIDWDSAKNEHIVHWSLRARKGEFNLIPVAQFNGGGGHPESAAFAESMQSFMANYESRFKIG